MQAIILAAGMGKRLGKYTNDNTKCMVKVNNKPLIEHAIESLLAANIQRIVIVVGYKASGLIDFVDRRFPDLDVTYLTNPVYDTTNNIYSLWLAREYLKADDTILLESDVVFDKSMIQEIVARPEKDLAVVSKFEHWMDGTVTLLDENETIVNVIDKKHFRWDDISDYYKTVNIYKFSARFSSQYYLPFLEAYLNSFGANQYYEQVLNILAYLQNSGLKAMRVSESRWYEIDDLNDLHVAELIFGAKGNRREMMLQRYGGYWRFPGQLDYCYLVNPYFPTPRMWDELKSAFKEVASQYPSGMAVQSHLAAKIFNVDAETIAVGNGAAELIASLVRCCQGKVGIVDPCFNEYPARVGDERLVRYDSSQFEFSYSIKDLIDFWAGKVDWAVLVNPDNPSGHFLSQDDVHLFIEECRRVKIRPIVDESFIDFAHGEQRFSLFNEAYLHAHQELVVIRSISKSYGVPGLRLGVLASGDIPLVTGIKKDVAIWNINSPGEFFLQIFDKYQRDYVHACDRIVEERSRLAERLTAISGVHVYPSQANYLLCRLDGSVTAREMAEYLFEKEAILIKDLTGKHGFSSGQFFRIAIRTKEENDRLLAGIALAQKQPVTS
jgi:histidinol-phosphate/aromatic aminotransferase/cobyric acid decarboxylase-like protein/choline kinase